MTRRVGAIAVAVVGCLALWAPAASAHARLLSTSPADGATVGPRVGAIVLRFDDVIQLVPRALVVTGATGAPLTTKAPRVVRGRSLAVDLTDELPSGRYFVAWRILADDGHVESGSFGFTVAASGAPAPPASAAVAPAAPQPVWPVVVAACLAAVAIGGAGLVVRRGLVAVRAAGANAVFSGDDHEASARERTPLRR